MSSTKSYSQRQQVLLLRAQFEYFYARALLELLPDSLKKSCNGCVTKNANRLYHQCVMLTTKEQIDFCFEDLLKQVDEQAVLFEWNTICTKVEHVHPGVLALYKLKLYCDDWRAADMKTESWKSMMRERMEELVKVDTIFDISAKKYY